MYQLSILYFTCVHVCLSFQKMSKNYSNYRQYLSDMIQRNSILKDLFDACIEMGKWHSYKEDTSKLFLLCDVTRRVDGKFPNMRCMRFLLLGSSAQLSTSGR